jgi:UDP-N-acetylmuramate dehydrogenase
MNATSPGLEGLQREIATIDGVALFPGAPLSPRTTFRIGGPAELLVEVGREVALSAVLSAVRAVGVPCFVLGLGSNLLVPDEGLSGVLLRLTGDLAKVRFEGTRVLAGGGVALPRLARRTVSQGLAGLEALAGFPSTVGGAVVMNAGSYGAEICDVLEGVRVVSPQGEARELETGALAASYRTTRLQGSGEIVSLARFRLHPGDAVAGLARIQELNRRRWSSLPSGHPNAGSIFRNPPGDAAGRLIDACGLKGRRSGKAEISPRHANVIVNLGSATARDVLALMLEARRAVEERFGIELEPEIVLAGGLRAAWAEATGSAIPRPAGDPSVSSGR